MFDQLKTRVRARWDASGDPEGYQRAKDDLRAQMAEVKSAVAEYRDDRHSAVEGLVASFDRVRLFTDRIECVPSGRRKDRGLAPDSRPVAGVRARVTEDRNGLELGGWDQRDVYLTITGPGFEWAVRTDAIWSSRKARDFAALVNGAGSAGEIAYLTDSDLDDLAGPDIAGQLERLAKLRSDGALSEHEYAAAKGSVLGR